MLEEKRYVLTTSVSIEIKQHRGSSHHGTLNVHNTHTYTFTRMHIHTTHTHT